MYTMSYHYVLDDTCSVCVGQNRSDGVGVEVLLKMEGQVFKWQTKYAATPKQEVLGWRDSRNVKQLTELANSSAIE